ncbi:MAG: DtxR family transcriptional regulator, partial [Planctomycetota bacterium]
TTALRTLSEKGLVHYRPYQAVTLTEEGREVADRIEGRHQAISAFLDEILLVEEDVAEENACRMEHVLDRKVIRHLSLFAQFVRECPRAGEDWLKRFQYYIEHEGETPENEEMLKEWIQDVQGEMANDKTEGSRTMTLDEVDTGDSVKVRKVGGSGAIRRRMIDMGAVRGTPVEVVKVAPMGDPIEVKIKGYNLTLRKKEAAQIEVEMDSQ